MENNTEKLERHEARNYLRGLLRFPELKNNELHKKAIEYAKNLQIAYVRSSIKLNISDDELYSLIEIFFPYEAENSEYRFTLDDMNEFVKKRENILK